MSTRMSRQEQGALPRTQARVSALSLRTAVWEGRSHSEAPLHPHQGVAGGGSEDGSGLVSSNM